MTSRTVHAPVVRPRRRLLGLLGELVASPGGATALVLTGAVVAVALLADWAAPPGSFAAEGLPLRPPSAEHPFGTDDLGRDLLAGVIQGTRTSLLVAAGVAVIAGTIAAAVGAVSGYTGGRIDDALMRLTELVQVVPRFFLAVIVIALWGPGLDKLILLLGLTSWTWTARVVRAEVLSLREREFVAAARALGASDRRILARHVLPNVLPPTVVMISVVASGAILIEAGLSFIGLGDPTAVSLGELASNAQRFLRAAWWLAVFPGGAIVVAILGINLLGDECNDLLGVRRDRRGRRRQERAPMPTEATLGQIEHPTSRLSARRLW